jgi:hypothetical protein
VNFQLILYIIPGIRAEISGKNHWGNVEGYSSVQIIFQGKYALIEGTFLEF